MSVSAGNDVGYSYVAIGTYRSGTATTAAAMQPSASTQVSDLVVACMYTNVDPSLAVDAGDGWVRLGYGWDSTNSYGFSVWAMIASRAGATVNGLTLASSGSYGTGCAVYRARSGFRFDLSGAVSDGNWYNATADSRVQSWNPVQAAGNMQFTLQGLTVLCAGCKNNATVLPTATSPTGYTERFDNGTTAAPSFQVWMGDKTTHTQGSPDYYSTVTNSTFWSNTSSRTNRCSIRVYIPVVGNTYAYRGRNLAGRRISG